LEVALRLPNGVHVEGRDVFVDLPLAPWEAALGAKIEVQAPGGAIELTVPHHVQTGRKLRLKGRGIPGHPAGHLYAVVKIVIPPVESARARELYRDLARELVYDPRAGTGG
ncbi:MAG: DnaJ C-terminal domain-containing protein, partial [Litorimonas sp.]